MWQVVNGFIKPFRTLFYSTGTAVDIQKLLLISAIFSGFFLFTINYNFPLGSSQFIDYANALATGSHLTPDIAQRDIGFPFLLWISGYPYHHSMIGITLIHTMMAILIPVLVYLTITLTFPRIAYYVALITILTLSPFYYLKWIHHDQSYVFFSVLSVYLLNIFIVRKKTRYLYAMTAAVIATSLTRPAGNLLFPIFITLAFLFVRGNIRHYIVSIGIVICIMSLYSYHRYEIFEMSKYDHMPSYTGEQVFYNLYLNSKEFGIQLSPSLGPNMKAIIDNAYKNISSKELLSEHLTVMQEPDAFRDAYFYPFQSEKFKDQLFELPNWEYYCFICRATQTDATFLNASWEIIRQYPLYPFSYTLRNLWLLLYEPGYAHTRYNVNPFGKIGIETAFAFDTQPIQLYHLTKRAERELVFNTYIHQYKSLQKIYKKMRKHTYNHYLTFVKILFYCMLVAWISVCVGLWNRVSNSNISKVAAKLFLSDKITGPVVATSIILLENIFITSMFAEPDLRYHNFIIPLKIIVAGFGLGITWHVLHHVVKMITHTSFAPFTNIQNIKHLSYDNVRNRHTRTVVLGLFIISIFLFWSSYIIIHTS